MPAIKDFKVWGGACLHCGGVMGATCKKALGQKKFCSLKCMGAFKRVNRTAEEDLAFRQEATRRRYLAQHNNPSRYIWALINRTGRKHLKLGDMLSLLEAQEGLCALSGVPLTFVKIYGEAPALTNLSIDRLDPLKGYELDNIHFVCTIVNKMKHTLSLDELYWWCEQVVEHEDA